MNGFLHALEKRAFFERIDGVCPNGTGLLPFDTAEPFGINDLAAAVFVAIGTQEPLAVIAELAIDDGGKPVPEVRPLRITLVDGKRAIERTLAPTIQ